MRPSIVPPLRINFSLDSMDDSKKPKKMKKAKLLIEIPETPDKIPKDSDIISIEIIDTDT
jgi:hypothetical protein